MAGNKARIRVAQMARVWLATLGTAAPADAVVAMPTGWFDVGLFTPTSLQWSTTPSFQVVKSHQSNYPTRRFQDGDDGKFQVDLQEWSGDNFIAVYGGGTITAITPPTTPPQFKFSPPAVNGRTNVEACIEIIDGDLHFRRIIPAAMQDEGVAQTFDRSKESTLPLRMAILGSDIGDPWYDLTDDPAFDPATSLWTPGS